MLISLFHAQLLSIAEIYNRIMNSSTLLTDPAFGAAILERLGAGNLSDDLLARLKEPGEDPTQDSPPPSDRG